MSPTRLFTDLIGLLANILSNLMPGQHIFRKEVHCQFSVYVYQSHCLFNNCSLFCNCCCDFLHFCTYYCKHYTVPTPRAIFFYLCGKFWQNITLRRIVWITWSRISIARLYHVQMMYHCLNITCSTFLLLKQYLVWF